LFFYGRPFLMAAGAVARLNKRGIVVKSILVGAEHRRRPRSLEPWIVVAQVANSPLLAGFESETFAIHSLDNIPKLHKPSVFPEECLATYDFACKAGFKNSAHLLIVVPIPTLAKLKNFEKVGIPNSVGLELQARLERYKFMCKAGFRNWAHLLICVPNDKMDEADFDKLGVPPSVGVELQIKLRQKQNPAAKRVVRPNLEITPPTTAVQYQTTRELLCSNEFLEFADCLQTVPIDRLVYFSSQDFKELKVPYLYGRCIQQILRRAEEPKEFTLF
jgi:hypothetical protein